MFFIKAKNIPSLPPPSLLKLPPLLHSIFGYYIIGINRVRKWTFSAQARARWYLALTLARNPQLASDRKPDVQAPQPAQAGHARHGDVVIEIDQFCADNTALIQDK